VSAAVTERTVRTSGAELRVVDAGEGPLVVLAHGFPELSYSWRHQIPVLAEAGYRVLAPDQRGYSPGARPEGRRAYRLTECAGDVLALLDAAGLESAHVVGHDWGGSVAWQVYDGSGRPTSERGSLQGVPAWSFAAPFANKDGSFSILF